MHCSSLVFRYANSFIGRKVPIIPDFCPKPLPHILKSNRYSQVNFTNIQVRCYSASSFGKKKKKSKNMDDKDQNNEDEDSFYVVRKGDIVGVYKNFSDCQSQVGFSIHDPPANVFKGKSLSKDAEKYLSTHALRNALYTIRADDVREDLFGSLSHCPMQPSDEEALQSSKLKKRSQDVLEPQSAVAGLATSLPSISSDEHIVLKTRKKSKSSSDSERSCILEFDGASKGNPGNAGAGAILRNSDGTLICKLREGIGQATNNVAEYRAMILGLRSALAKGFTKINVRGDSKLVCMQINGSWKVKHDNILSWYKEAKRLSDKFRSFEIAHVLRESNSEADAQANLAVGLADGEVREDPADV